MKKTIILALTGVSLIVGAGIASAKPAFPNIKAIDLYGVDSSVVVSTQTNQPQAQAKNPYTKSVGNFSGVPNRGGKYGYIYNMVTLSNQSFTDTQKAPELTIQYNGVNYTFTPPEAAFSLGASTAAIRATQTPQGKKVNCGDAKPGHPRYTFSKPIGTSKSGLQFCYAPVSPI